MRNIEVDADARFDRDLEMDEDDDLEANARRQCVDCGILSPKTETSFTLISARHGWRLTRNPGDPGGHLMQWRCPTCWGKYRQSGLEEE